MYRELDHLRALLAYAKKQGLVVSINVADEVKAPRIPHWRWVSSGANRDRTGDLLNAIQALSQLSYSPGPFAGRPWEGCRTGAGS